MCTWSYNYLQYALEFCGKQSTLLHKKHFSYHASVKQKVTVGECHDVCGTDNKKRQRLSSGCQLHQSFFGKWQQNLISKLQLLGSCPHASTSTLCINCLIVIGPCSLYVLTWWLLIILEDPRINLSQHWNMFISMNVWSQILCFCK